ncbi:MAG: 6-phosphofructokinase [Candidatus Bathyarchaeota archaeon]|nr:MAG: 6-phosphofructokinase [Candidatus Bathyarchaeota archaeon]
MKKLGVVTSGGDAPGMNATIRAITRVAHSKGLEVFGFERGWEGLMKARVRPLTPRSVGGILGQGGTILYTARSPNFETEGGLEMASRTLKSNEIDGLIVIGGDGSFRGANKLSFKTDTLIVGIPASIDNDVFGTDETIGFDTAVNTAVTEIDKIRDTAISHDRIFIIEVMGKKRGFLALAGGIAAGAEVILIPEVKIRKQKIVQTIKENDAKGKKSSIIVAAEGIGDTRNLAKNIEKQTGSEVRLSVLGYAQRGGSPTARSRLLACLFGNKAVESVLNGQGSRIVGLKHGKIVTIDLEETCKIAKPLDLGQLELAHILAT